MPFVRSLPQISTAAAAVALLAGCGDSGTEASDLPLVKKGTLTVCAAPPAAAAGFEEQLADRIADDIGAKKRIVEASLADIESGAALKAKTCDLAAGVTATAEHRKTMALTKPYAPADHALVAQKDAEYEDLGDLKGKKLGVQSGTAAKAYADDKAKDADVIVYDELDPLLKAVKTGKIQAGLATPSAAQGFAKDGAETAAVSTGERHAFAARRSSKEILGAANDALAKAREDGSYARTYKKHFGSAPKGA
ncbi:transporter substrate-binding domain-containing protein [Streptomyces sp. A7024]|uniref:Transporter substrate-binding domain-containing protein n=1 Tax=Streptomyces coryli TaxID=1128680 RepID=A0A6G4U880_9ACTN|nr:transporter substrate-binding domain-containing protein [Streptomyces coryli]